LTQLHDNLVLITVVALQQNNAVGVAILTVRIWDLSELWTLSGGGHRGGGRTVAAGLWAQVPGDVLGAVLRVDQGGAQVVKVVTQGLGGWTFAFATVSGAVGHGVDGVLANVHLGVLSGAVNGSVLARPRRGGGRSARYQAS